MAAEIDQAFAAGMAAVQAQDYTAAEQFFRHAVSLQPASHQAWNALAWTQLWSGQPEIALEYARRASDLARHKSPEYLNTIGVAQGELGEFAEAEAALRKALKLKPAYVDGLINLAKVLLKQGHLAETVKTYERAYAFSPRFPKLAFALAQMYRKQGRAGDARELLERAGGEDNEDHAMAVAEVISELETPTRATDWLRRVAASHPDWRLVKSALAQICLADGQWREGWHYYLLRLEHRSPLAPAPQPLPERLDGKSVLLRGEQGIGDVLFFLRFAPLLGRRGARVTLACERKLAAFVAARAPLDAVRESAPDDGRAPEFDFRVWCGDLPALLETEELPPAWPLSASDAAVAGARERLASYGPGPYLGVTWRAGTDILRRREFGNDRTLLMKELPPAALGAALRGWRGTVLALQRNLVAADLAAFSAALGAPAQDLSALGDDLPALLGLLSQIDEYVGVSNANDHLLAGVGRTARVLVPYPGEWRWMRREGPSPWFPGFTTYREPQSRGWQKPLLDLRKDLSL